MDESKSQGVMPIVEKDGRWQSKDYSKEAAPKSGAESGEDHQDEPRRPLPLPFGKIDVVA